MLKLENVSKTYFPNVKALRNVNLEVQQGEFVFVVGRSGMGKSTLIKLIIGDEQPDSGKIMINRWVINELKHSQIPYYRRQIGVVFQDYKLLEKKTAAENVAFAMEVSGMTNAQIRKDVPKILEMVGLKDKGQRFPRELSGGEQQRIAIARALVHNPKLLIADEPTGNLDIHNTEEIIDLLDKINRAGTTVIMTTHNKPLVDRMKRRVITIENGEVTHDREEARYRL